MNLPLFTWFILVCKIVICVGIILAFHTHYWIRDITGSRHFGIKMRCENYGRSCVETVLPSEIQWFYCILALISVLFELLNMICIWRKKRSRLNLLLEELDIIAILILLVITALTVIAGFYLGSSHPTERVDWSFFVFVLATALTCINFICSLIRVVSYCRENSFRSNTVTYQSRNDHQMAEIQS